MAGDIADAIRDAEQAVTRAETTLDVAEGHVALMDGAMALLRARARSMGVRVGEGSKSEVGSKSEPMTTPPIGWVTVDVAAQFLGTTPRALRKRLGRAARRAADAVTAKVGGIEAKQIGRSWRVHFPPSWRRD